LDPVLPASAKTVSTSPRVWGVTAKVVSPTPVCEVELPTGITTPGVAKVNWSAVLVLLVPDGVVTVTCTVEAPSAGEVMVIEVAEWTTKPVPAVAPNFTDVAPVKLVPVRLTDVPPAVVPELGLTPVTEGPVESGHDSVPESFVVPDTVWNA
jgi:hypothetical protein